MPLLQRRLHETRPLASNSTATLQIPKEGKLQNIILYFRNSTNGASTEADVRSQINNITLTLDGTQIVNASAAQLYDLYETMGVNVAANTGINGALELNVGRLIMVDPVARAAFGLGTANVTSIQIQVTCGTLTTGVASCYALTSRENVTENLGQHFRFINYPRNFNSTGDDGVDTLPRDIDSAYALIMASAGASGTIASGEVRVNGQIVQERVDLNANAQVQATYGFVQPAGYFVHNFSDRSLGGLLPMVGANDLRIITNFAVAPGAAGYNLTALTLNGIRAKA